ncbi:hypothetical protein BD779DRAFT_1558345 [Infundibulicybe gibba]|nr:hypothetical protein BD779DRAFT_1558345 [Infundibulicybe gibba]
MISNVSRQPPPPKSLMAPIPAITVQSSPSNTASATSTYHGYGSIPPVLRQNSDTSMLRVVVESYFLRR